MLMMPMAIKNIFNIFALLRHHFQHCVAKLSILFETTKYFCHFLENNFLLAHLYYKERGRNKEIVNICMYIIIAIKSLITSGLKNIYYAGLKILQK